MGPVRLLGVTFPVSTSLSFSMPVRVTVSTGAATRSIAALLLMLLTGLAIDPMQAAAQATQGGGVWVAVADVEAPSSRYDHTALWTGSEMLVWGGSGAGANLGDGGRYSPATDAWSPMSMIGAPAPRSHHVAVWTGMEMVIWGGRGNTGVLGDGAAYNRSTDSWRPLPQSPFPPAADATGVWTGSEMILCCSTMNAAYNPTADTWRSVPAEPTGNGQPPRFNQIALWTGGAMIVAGGAICPPAECVDAGPGSAYTPVTNSWSPLPCLGPGVNGTAIWTGLQAIFSGGSQARFNALGVGSTRVTLPTAVCTPPSSVNAPTTRINHSAVWTGAAMLVWGGTTLFHEELGDGSAYDPVADTWQPLPTDGAPSVRGHHTAVWTGNEMIVWGGANGGYQPQAIGDGSRYFPPGSTPPRPASSNCS
jgi:hypothetical protein